MLRLAFLSPIISANARKFFNSAYSLYLPVPQVRRLGERLAILSREMKLRAMVLAVACAIIAFCAAPTLDAQTFQDISPMSTARAFSASVVLNDGTVLLLGGSPASPSEDVDIYNPATQTFTDPTNNLLAPLSGIAAALLNDGTVLVVGSVPVNPT